MPTSGQKERNGHKMTEKSFTQRVTVVVPSYQPDEKLCRIFAELENEGFDDIIVINDGSSPEKKAFFPDPKEHPAVTLLEHEVNRGKGAALKTAFEYFRANRPDRVGVVTADGDAQQRVQRLAALDVHVRGHGQAGEQVDRADGDAQHRAVDIAACSRLMVEKDAPVLGVRNFDLEHVPAKSRMGNKITSTVFLLLCGLKISDTQTGLRAIPASYLGELCQVDGDRYEYETNMLLFMNLTAQE